MDERILADLKDSYGIVCREISPVAGGWLNLKWKISAVDGDWLVKQFSRQRFSLEKLVSIEAALQRQILLHRDGVLCPRIRPCGGRAIRFLDEETAYMVMAFCPGWTESPETVTLPQLYSLGSACGAMHRAFSRLPVLSVTGFPLDGRQVIDSLRRHIHAALREAPADVPAAYREAVLLQEPILNRLTPAFFERLPKGIAHEDFASDNILFGRDGVSAIIDFDRNQYSYLWHDIGRAVLSFALLDGRLNVERVRAFVAGYSQHLPLTLPDVADALRLSWCIETPWWIEPGLFRETEGKTVRFKEEILWITTHWSALDSLLSP